MICPGCRQPCPPDFAFCPHCGAALESANAATARPASGNPLPASPSDPERRVITILFCDVVGSVALEEHLDPEEALEVMNGAFAALAPLHFEA